jgi:hypothetical protein
MFVSAGATDSGVHRLVRACAEAYKDGCSQAVATPNLDETFNVQLLLSMLLRVSVNEMMAVLQASQVRAQALASSRAGRPAEAHAALDLAHSIGAAAGLSPEASCAERSFQASAAAYLQYKAGHPGAETALLTALDCCRTLRDQFDYATEGRRIHLVRHVIRLRSAAGQSEEAFQIACRMVRYVDGDIGAWPFPEVALSKAPDVLTAGDRLLLLDQVLSEMSSLLAGNPAAAAMLARTDRALFRRDVSRAEDLSRVYLRLSAMRASVEGDVIAFLESATAFFRGGPGEIPRAWKEMSREFIQVCRQVAPAVAIVDEDGEPYPGAPLQPDRSFASYGSDPVSRF